MSIAYTEMGKWADKLERELEEARASLDVSAANLLKTVVDRNRLGVQLDLIRDELKRIEARILESRFNDDPHLSNILDYCRRSQSDIATSYSLIGERDRLEAENRKLKIALEDQLTAHKEALEKCKSVLTSIRRGEYSGGIDEALTAINELKAPNDTKIPL